MEERISIPKRNKGQKRSRTAAGPGAGYLFQLERALERLADGLEDSVVGIETLDDISVRESDRLVVREQNKHSIVSGSQVFSDRSHALWNTLSIWLDPAHGPEADRYFLVTNRRVTTPLASLLKKASDSNSSEILQIVSKIRQVGEKRRPGPRGELQALIDSVLAYSDSELARLIGRIEVIEVTDADLDRRQRIASRFAVSRSVDREELVFNLLGWLMTRVMDCWRVGEPAWISRAQCVEQCRAVEHKLIRRTILPRPRTDVVVSEAERDEAMARPFVQHLTRIDAEREDVVEAVEHFLQFNIEKHRLTMEGEIPDSEWGDRSVRLQDRWRRVLRSAKRQYADQTSSQIGMRVFEDTTYNWREPLAGQDCHEHYMTSGHYHRLADEDEVWWHPDYVRPQET